MIDFYRRLGWTVTEIELKKPIYGEIREKVVFVDVHEVVLGRNCSPKIWSRVYKDVYYFLLSQDRILPTYFDSIRIKTIEIFS